jgi:CelD/BcsL family acetyltransferase involved in cellulose biosynthesis
VVAAIDSALIREGHHSIVVAPQGSSCDGELRPTTVPAPPFTDAVVSTARAEFGRALAEVIRRDQPDLVHLHGVDAFEYLPTSVHTPVVVTLHLWPDRYPPGTFRARSGGVHVVCVSDAQRLACPDTLNPTTIRNGVDLEFYRPGPSRFNTVLLLGRICPEKGFHLAIDAALEAGLDVIVAGAVFPYPSHQEYFRWVIAPRLNGRVTFVESPDRSTKRELLRTACCVAIPTIVPETSSLVAMEALASGTPVVAFRTPALADLVDHGRTGFLVADCNEMRDALGRATSLSSADCRRAAEERCAADQMIDGYVRLYETIARRREPSFELDVLSRLADIEALADEWDQLWRRSSATPFQHPAWTVPWLRHLRAGTEVACVTVRRGARLVGIVPFVRLDASGGIWQLAGAGISDYLGGVVEDANVESAWRVLERWTHWLPRNASRIELDRLRSDDPLLRFRPAHVDEETMRAESCPALSWPRRARFETVLPSAMRANVRYYRRRLDRLGRVDIRAATRESLPTALASLFDLHGRRWAERGSSGVLAADDVRRFHESSAPRLLDAGLLTVFTLAVDERIVATAYCLHDNACVYYYLGGFDPTVRHASPGTVLLEHAIRVAWERGATTFDFLRGRERYKYLWGARDHDTYRRRLSL